MHALNQWTGLDRLPRFHDPISAIVWAASGYLASAVQGKSPPPAFRLVISRVLPLQLHSVLTDAIEFLMFHSTVPVSTGHEGDTTGAPQALALGHALEALHAGCLQRYCSALSPVLLAEDALALGESLQAIADAMIVTRRRGFQQSARVPEYRTPVESSLH